MTDKTTQTLTLKLKTLSTADPNDIGEHKLFIADTTYPPKATITAAITLLHTGSCHMLLNFSFIRITSCSFEIT